MKPEVFRKYSTLYQEILTDSKQCLLYNVVFCIRRFHIVLVNVFFSQHFLKETFTTDNYLLKIFSFLVIQSIYIVYIWETMPHTMDLFNKLELFNEGFLILLAFLMICYAGIGDKYLTESIQEAIFPQIVSLVIISIIVLANVFVMLKITFSKLLRKCMLKK